MAKKKSERLEPVKMIREKQLKDEARKLAQASQALQVAVRQLNDLEQYLKGYYAEMAPGNPAFRSASDLIAYQQFVAKLNDAIGRQRQVVAIKEAGFKAQQRRWITASANVETMDRLIVNARVDEQKKEDKRDQKIVDELSTRAYLSNMKSE